MDLNIIVSGSNKETQIDMQNKIQMSVKMGYKLIAFNTVAVGSRILKMKKIPGPKTLPQFDEKLQILQRLTVVVENIQQLKFILSKPKIKKFDLFAICPESEDVLKEILNIDGACDIISFPLGSPMEYSLSRELLNTSSDNKPLYEIQYSDLFCNSNRRMQLMKNSWALVASTKDIIITSGINDKMSMRSPQNVYSHISTFFGMNRHQGKECLITRPHQLVTKINSTLKDTLPDKFLKPDLKRKRPIQEENTEIVPDNLKKPKYEG